jgi:hypothetical protein
MTIQVDNALPPNVVEIGNEITQGVVDGLMSATPAPTSANPYATKLQLDGKLSLTGGTITGSVDLAEPSSNLILRVFNNGLSSQNHTDIYGGEIQINDGNTLFLFGSYIEFPDGSIQTSAPDVPTFATTAEAQAGTSTTTVINPATLREMLMTSNVTKINSSMITSTTGTGGTNDGTGTDFQRLTCPNSAANVIVTRYRTINVQKGSSLSANMSFANGVALAFRLSLGSTTGTDPNSTGVIAIGEGTVQTAVFPTVRSIGIQLNYGSNIKILAHDGTTLTTYTTSTSVASLYLNASDFLLTNDYATGTVTLYLNGTSIGSTTGGVTSHASGFNARNQFNARAFNQSVPSGGQLSFTIFGATAIIL